MSIKFLADFMLGKLARELRILGFDTEYLAYDKLTDKTPFGALKIAQNENRILLTRNKKLKNSPQVFFIESEIVQEQVIQVLTHFKLHKDIKLGSRCLICNSLLNPIPKETVKGRVPYYIYKTQNEFVFCARCQKIYWAGSHYLDMQNRLKKYCLPK
ncbi:MAG: Mut7-C RNAse domain-containing protein [candidate division WOR-3 bacterium]|nr:Mut7-C RNAse domain-containing protein [candidate division WOR-3 bacterium]MDW7987962.1 Mut7-C RNAse domain-containing protein [candidate division WOR-3 bacterium]